MSGKEAIRLEKILNHPAVKKATDDINAESLERRSYSPLRCEVFSHPYTIVQETDRYRFELDRQAEKLLPDIIANKVQLIEGKALLSRLASRRDDIPGKDACICRQLYFGSLPIVGVSEWDERIGEVFEQTALRNRQTGHLRCGQPIGALTIDARGTGRGELRTRVFVHLYCNL